MEDGNFKDGICPMPFEFQPSVLSFDKMEKRFLETSDLLQTPHCHLPPTHFPNTFNGKIIYIERDPREVVVSGFHFFRNLFKDYMGKLFTVNTGGFFLTHIFLYF